MLLQKQPNPYSCTATSWAMVLGIPVTKLFVELGHDGGEICRPDQPEPKNRRGFHPQELIRITGGYAVTPIELFPVLNGLTLDQMNNWWYFRHIIKCCRGVIEGQGHHCKHAVAFERGLIYDPAGEIYKYSRKECERRDFYTQCAWRFYDL